MIPNRFVAAAVASLATLAVTDARAAGQLSTQVSANRVEVGQEFTLQLTCMVSGNAGTPTDPKLVVPRGITARGPSLSTQQNVSIINGQIQQQSGIVATWVLTASVLGRFRIGPASISANGQRLTDRAVEVEVVERGTLARPSRSRRRGLGFDPFDPFGSFDPFGGVPLSPGQLPTPGTTLDDIRPYPPDLNTDRAKDPVAFLDVRVSSSKVVVGEQITLRVYAYGKPGPFELGLTSEPSRNDFLSYQNERDNPVGPLYRIKLDSEVWFARKVLSYALFPNKSGRLRIGEAEATFAGAGLLGSNAYRNVQRKSEPLEILVEEPPLAGRPPGYHLGDVGSFRLSTNVEPRQIKASESVSVQVEVSGTGQLPQRLDPPEQHGVEWLEPTITQQIDDQRERIAGRRQFAFVVRVDRTGSIDLGQIRFPYFDPNTRKYALATADLGLVTVEPVANASGGGANTDPAKANGPYGSSEDPFLAALNPHASLGNAGTPTPLLADRPGFFYALVAGPLLSLAVVTGRAGWRRFSAWRQRVTGSAKASLQKDLKAAQTALELKDPANVGASVERLVHGLLEHSVGLKSRGILRADLPKRFEQAGLNGELGRQLVALLDACDELRFVRPDLEDARVTLEQAKAVFGLMLSRLGQADRSAT